MTILTNELYKDYFKAFIHQGIIATTHYTFKGQMIIIKKKYK